MTMTSQSDLAYLALEREIVTLRLKPGSLVTEGALIALAGFGRTPVREAIQKLAWQGLIAVKARVGLQISAIGRDDHVQIMQTRRALEPIAARLAASHASAEDRASMIDIAKVMTACSISGDIEGFLTADKSFDGVMEAACPNAFLIAALQPLQTHARRIWFATSSPDRMDRSIDLHVKVIRAIHKADAAQAEAAMGALMAMLAESGDAAPAG